MERGADIGVVREQLQGIAMLLLSFAMLADRVCFVPRSVRASVMSFLRPAETVALEFVAGEMPASLFIRPGDDVADAARLAVSFRALALVLAGVAARMSGCSGDHHDDRTDSALRRSADIGNAAGSHGSLAPSPFDTS